MYEPVKHLCCLLYQVTLIGVIFEFFICQIKMIQPVKTQLSLISFYTRTNTSPSDILTWLQVKNHVQRLAIVRHLLIQTRQVKLVLDVVFINLEHMVEESKQLLMAMNATAVEALRESLTGLLGCCCQWRRQGVKIRSHEC